MKSIKKLFILSLLAFSFVATGCEIPVGEPTETRNPEEGSTTTSETYKKGGKTITEETSVWDDGSTKETVYVEDKDGNYSEESHTKEADGTTIDETVNYDEKTRIETTDSTTKKTDGTEIVYHEEAKREGGGEGKNVKESFEATETTTFPAEDASGKTKEVTESTGSKELNAGGNLVERKSSGKTTTDYKDGSKEETTFEKTEDFTGEKTVETYYEETSTKTNTDGSQEIVETKQSDFNLNCPNPDDSYYQHSYCYSDVTTTKKDASGKVTSKVQEQIDTQNPDDPTSFVKKVTTTTNVSDNSTTVETCYPCTGGNDGLYIRETKDSAGKTTSKFREYVFVGYIDTYGADEKLASLKLDETSKKYEFKPVSKYSSFDTLYKLLSNASSLSDGKRLRDSTDLMKEYEGDETTEFGIWFAPFINNHRSTIISLKYDPAKDELIIYSEDGHTEFIASSDSWKFHEGTVLQTGPFTSGTVTLPEGWYEFK